MKAGIIGLQMVGKTTVFNVLSRGKASAAGGTGRREPNVTSVKVPDARLDYLASVFHPEKTTHAVVEFVDLPALGFYDALSEGAVVVEWADRAGEALPADHLRISFEVTGESTRRLMFQAGGPKSRGLAEALNLSP